MPKFMGGFFDIPSQGLKGIAERENMKTSKMKARGFTMIEIMVAIAIIVVLATILVVLVGNVNTKGKVISTQNKITMLGEAVEAFKQATGQYPLSVPEDAWDTSITNWSTNGGFAETMKWHDTTKNDWTDYFVPTDTTNKIGLPRFNTWTAEAKPTNIQMLTFQLEQVPQSNSIMERIKQGSGQIQQMYFLGSASGEIWTRAGDDCRINTPLNTSQTRIAFQPVDAWGTPLRFWTSDVLKWAKRTGNTWNDETLQLLSNRLQKSNWTFFIESAGKDGKFGWWGHPETDPNVAFNAQEAEDNIYKQ
jgi:prepilin-type N-terminal cleavage/methylation domain-containing protein